MGTLKHVEGKTHLVTLDYAERKEGIYVVAQHLGGGLKCGRCGTSVLDSGQAANAFAGDKIQRVKEALDYLELIDDDDANEIRRQELRAKWVADMNAGRPSPEPRLSREDVHGKEREFILVRGVYNCIRDALKNKNVRLRDPEVAASLLRKFDVRDPEADKDWDVPEECRDQ